MPLFYDYKRSILGDVEYEANQSIPVLNWLRYRQVAKAAGRDADREAMQADLQAITDAGFLASADSMNSFWTTYQRALDLWYGDWCTAKQIPGLIERVRGGAYVEVNEIFAEFAKLAHVRGNFILVPRYLPSGYTRSRSMNTLRGGFRSKWRDYWDLTLVGIKTGEFDEFFKRSPQHPEFDLDAQGGFDGYIDRNDLDMYVDTHGSVKPLWPGHLDEGAKALSQSKEDVMHFVENACSVIREREHRLAA
ncbi:hypothetical protein [Brevibacterium sp. SMBL_HHYL_HB1]|uniref:hypothetical protein n=1 Tax=Brevibacterium sp. SMBL_HHYL_HB1 TaxID=2777556 RepID=UPI001BACDDF4|nr:hypothetical protein [Brevibacterium sp. SMBL_HHYL_HB1]QUL77861.1 hypothetical protein IG171_10100 [Brevibacterium sp. SMBL_HHYL_HB1]